MKIAIGNDHNALNLKAEILKFLKKKDIEIIDFGTMTTERCDYPIYAEKVALSVTGGEADFGILLCGSGAGMAMAANSFPGVRAVICSEPYTAMMSRMHNNSNILTLGERVVGSELAKMIVEKWLTTEFVGGRHQERMEMIAEMRNRKG